MSLASFSTIAVLVGAAVMVGSASPWVPFGALAIGKAVFILLGLWLARDWLKVRPGLRFKAGVLIASGKWLLVGGAAPVVAGFFAAALVAALAGAEMLGYAEAARILAQPLLVTAFGMNAVLGPRSMAAARVGEERQALRIARIYVLLLSAVGGVLVLAIGFDTSWNPIASVLPNAYMISGLVAMAIVANLLNSFTHPARYELIGADRERRMAGLEIAGNTIRVVVATSARWLGSYAIPLSFAALGVIRLAVIRRLLVPVYADSGRREEDPKIRPGIGHPLRKYLAMKAELSQQIAGNLVKRGGDLGGEVFPPLAGCTAPKREALSAVHPVCHLLGCIVIALSIDERGDRSDRLPLAINRTTASLPHEILIADDEIRSVLDPRQVPVIHLAYVGPGVQRIPRRCDALDECEQPGLHGGQRAREVVVVVVTRFLEGEVNVRGDGVPGIAYHHDLAEVQLCESLGQHRVIRGMGRGEGSSTVGGEVTVEATLGEGNRHLRRREIVRSAVGIWGGGEIFNREMSAREQHTRHQRQAIADEVRAGLSRTVEDDAGTWEQKRQACQLGVANHAQTAKRGLVLGDTSGETAECKHLNCSVDRAEAQYVRPKNGHSSCIVPQTR